MNQILVTGYDGDNNQNIGGKLPKEKRPKIPKERKPKKVLAINPIVVFYAISIMILGICFISGSIFVKTKINETVSANARPVLNINKNDSDNTLEMEITHIRGIKQIKYMWNDDSSTEEIIQGNGQKAIKETIKMLGGQNNLTIEITEENGKTVTYKNTYTSNNVPEIKFEPVSNGIKIIISSETEIDYIAYKWDSGEQQKVEIGENEYEGIINIPQGQHKLKLEVVDENGTKTTKEQPVIGDTAPTVGIKAALVDGKVAFVVDAEDDTGLSKIEITINGEIKEQIENYTEKTYHKEIPAVNGENKVIVTVYNVNNLKEQKGAKLNNNR